jgi:hypothetical protein
MSEHQLLLKLGQFQRTGTGELNFNCPFCIKRIKRPDKGFHLYVNPTKYINGIRGWFYCQRCKARGPMSRLFGDEIDQGMSASKWREFVTSLRGKNVVEPAPKVQLPKDYTEMIRGTDAYKYLASRRITDDQITHYKIGFGTEDLQDRSYEERKHYAGSGRIVFPDFDSDGECVYWVARTYRGHKVKYKNPPAVDAGHKVYNLANASMYREVVITEGVISSIAAGYNAVATYGKEVTTTQLTMLVQAAFERYLVALDGDARKEALSLAERLSRRGCRVSLVQFYQDEDPASVGPAIQERLDLALPFDSLRARVMFRMAVSKR